MVVLTALLSLPVLAYDFQVNGICYNKYNDGTVGVTYSGSSQFDKSIYSGDIVIPSEVEYQGVTYSVTSIGSNAFYGCSDLTSITIPNSVTIIYSDAFAYCESLTSITIPNSVTKIGPEAFWACDRLTSITIPSSVTEIGVSAFYGCDRLASVNISDIASWCKINFDYYNRRNPYTGIYTTDKYNAHSNPLVQHAKLILNGQEVNELIIPDTVKVISYNAFHGCNSLTSVLIPNSVTYIGVCAFRGCSNLTSVNIPNSVTRIGEYAFAGCTGLTSVNIPSSVMSIESYAFQNCSGLTSITIPSSVTSIGNSAFYEYGDVFAPSASRELILNAGVSGSRFYALEGNNWGDHVTALLQGFKCHEPYIESKFKCKNIKLSLSDGTQLKYTKTEDGYYIVKDLEPGEKYSVVVSYIDADNVQQSCQFDVETITPSLDIYYSRTQSTITVTGVYASSDETTASISEKGIRYNGKEYTKFPAVLDRIFGPEEKVTVEAFAKYGMKEVSESFTITTKTLTANVTNTSATTASSFGVVGGYTEGDATITDEVIKVNGKVYEGNKAFVTGLDPNKSYTVTYSLKANGKEFTATKSISTNALVMTTSEPKVVSVGNVIVAAESNISDEETNVGFEWRRTDWTDDFKSNTGGAYMYNGQMEGYIRNLNAEKLWKYRPYYLSDSGIYYYGDWVGLDPTNTSYFEATVHTYDKTQIEGNTALVKGYALRGTDAIKVQGFMYWKRVAGAKTRANDGRRLVSVPFDAKTVEASGQVMTATIKDLDYSTEYSYVAFATTSEGETFYGEEMTFTTGDDPTGIDDVPADNSSSEPASVIGYYDLSGRPVKNMQHGLYIIRYSDGTSRKIMKK